MNLFGWLKRSSLKREIIVNVEKLETRVAVLENGRLEEYMVEHPEDVTVTSHEEDDGTVTIELSVPQSEMGKVIGRQGRIAKAIRTVVKAASVKDDRKYMVEIIEK